MRANSLIPLALAALSLTACEAATEMAGDAIKEQIRTEFVAQCEQIAQDNGFASEKVGPACNCVADNLAADAADGSLEVDTQKVEELLRTCGAETGETGESAPVADAA
ncbi:hypothetical protein EH31_03655 [Erythrobacter longus]|uniref:Lipoprotein n=1 Tax=Erythrobacter longus TaxID=1044 RepID=A0A074ME64_ERYLO|nr:hypothetical protein [Erythrobacter longus]KEO91779.1 hypothetical protein EH31_03655 [Erythrobacter longus]